MARQGRQLAAILSFVDGEQDQRQPPVVADRVEQRLQGVHVVGWLRNVGALVGAEAREDGGVVVAHGAGMDLHHEAVGDAHAGEFGEHLGAEQFGIGRRRAGADHTLEQRGGLADLEVRGACGRVAVIGRGGAERAEDVTARPMRREIAAPGHGFAGERDEPFDVVAEPLALGVDREVGPVGRQDATRPALVPQRPVVPQVVERAVGGADRLDVEAFVEGAGAQVGPRERLRDRVVEPVGVGGAEPLLDAEDLRQRMLEPVPRRRAPEQPEVLREQAPDGAPVGLDRAAVAARHPERLKRHALRVQHAEDVVVGLDEQLGRVGEGQVLGIPPRVRVAVRRQDRQVLDAGVKEPRDRARPGLVGEQPVRVERHGIVLSERGSPGRV